MVGAMRALVLVLALSHTWAAVANDSCDQIKAKRLSPDNLDKVSVCLQSSSGLFLHSEDAARSPYYLVI